MGEHTKSRVLKSIEKDLARAKKSKWIEVVYEIHDFEQLVNMLNGFQEQHDKLLEGCKSAHKEVTKILDEYMERDAVGRRAKLPIEKELEAAITKAREQISL